MPKVSCPSCGRALNIGDNLAGARVRCPGCQTIFQAPTAVPAAPVAPPAARVARPPAPPASPAPAAASDNPFDFGGGASPAAPAPGAAFANLEDDSPERQRLRRRARWAASAMYRAIVALIAIPLFCFVLNLFIGGAMGASGGQIVVFGCIGFMIIVAVLALPVTFMWIGGRCLERHSSAGLAITGAIFAILAGSGMALEGVLSALSIAAGNFGGFIASPLYLLGAAANIYAGVVALSVATPLDAREVFGYR